MLSTIYITQDVYYSPPGTAHIPGHLKGTIVSPALLNDQFCRNGLLTMESLSEVGVAAKHEWKAAVDLQRMRLNNEPASVG